jgi:hypothetical protein
MSRKLVAYTVVGEYCKQGALPAASDRKSALAGPHLERPENAKRRRRNVRHVRNAAKRSGPARTTGGPASGARASCERVRSSSRDTTWI